MRLTFLALALLLQDDIGKYRKDLEDKAYGKLWDRRDAAKALGRMGTKEAAQVLLDFAGKNDPATREAVVLGIAAIKDDAVRGFVRDQMPKLDAAGRADVAWAFRRMNWSGAKDALHALLQDKVVPVRVEAVRALEALKDERVVEAIGDKAFEVAERALLAGATLKAKADVDAVKKRLADKDPRVQAAALRFLATLDRSAAEAASPKSPEAKMAAADITESIDSLKTLLDDKDWRVRVAAIGGLERLWTVEAVGLLIERLPKEDGRLILDIVLTLGRMTRKELGFEAKAWKSWWDAQKDTFKMPARDGKATNGAGKDQGTVSSFFNVPVLSKRVVFIIDCSGSMKNDDEIYKGKRKIDVAMSELEKAVGGLAKDAKVGVIMLSTEATAQKVRTMGAQLVAISAGPKKAVDFMKSSWAKIEDIRRGRGDIYDAILEAQDLPEADTVYLLTDGVPTDGKYIDREHFLDAIADEYRNRRVCVHAILIGSRGIDERLMEGTAEATGGIYMPRK